MQLIWKKAISIGLFCVGVSCFYVNCGEINLTAMEGREMASLSIQGSLPAPVNMESPLRVVLFIDQSHSMKYSGCPTDLDGTSPSRFGEPCQEGPGSDPEGKRFKTAKYWLSSLKLISLQAKNPNLIKISVIPFKGGWKQVTRDNQNFRFLSLDEAAQKIANLESDHLIEPIIGEKKMGTTVPWGPLETLKTYLREEMTALDATDQLDSALFEVVVMTDGVLRPVPDLLLKAKTLAGCPVSCTGNNSPACDPREDLGWQGGITPYLFCNSRIPQRFTEAFGTADENDPDKIALAIQEIAGLAKTFKAGRIKVRSVQTEYENTFTMSDRMWKQVEERFLNTPEISTYKVKSEAAPFVIQPRKQVQTSYLIKKFYAINMNAFVDENGQLVTDSDGDGLSDIEEDRIGYDPRAARSLVHGGRCLDSIFVRFGCEKVRQCDITLDEDGDTLNQCEEMTLGTSDTDSDTDADGIPDFFEIRGMGLDPNADESKASRSMDGFTDHQHFMAGVHVQNTLDKILDQNKVIFSMERLKESQAQSSEGYTVRTSQYRIQIQSLPLVPTLSIGSVSPLETFVRVNKKNTRVKLTGWDQFLPENQNIGGNTILVLAQIGAVENKNSNYWVVQRIEVPFETSSTFRGSVNLEDFKHLLYLK